MKTKHWFLFAALFLFTGTFSSQTLEDLERMNPEQRKEYINKLSPTERKQLIEQYRQNIIIDDLDLPKEKQDEFRKLYNEYQQSQSAIIERSKNKQDIGEMSEKQAQERLNRSFSVGQQLMDNRKKYTERFQKIMSPQQVLRMYDTEAMMREKVRERSGAIRSRGGDSMRSNQRNMRGNDRTNSPSDYPQRNMTPRRNNNPRTIEGPRNASPRSITPQRNTTPQRSTTPSSGRINSGRR